MNYSDFPVQQSSFQAQISHNTTNSNAVLNDTIPKHSRTILKPQTRRDMTRDGLILVPRLNALRWPLNGENDDSIVVTDDGEDDGDADSRSIDCDWPCEDDDGDDDDDDNDDDDDDDEIWSKPYR